MTVTPSKLIRVPSSVPSWILTFYTIENATLTTTLPTDESPWHVVSFGVDVPTLPPPSCSCLLSPPTSCYFWSPCLCFYYFARMTLCPTF